MARFATSSRLLYRWPLRAKNAGLRPSSTCLRQSLSLVWSVVSLVAVSVSNFIISETRTPRPACTPRAVFSIYRDLPGILIVLILKTSGMGKWYSWDFDCLIFVCGI